ncbi:hypothetical protein BGZ49_001476 [Haplosporangium sp. Z 27]|nr:hypothetical protein BGZ49_001476 [Haplosporangium sp. Z 27]
MDGVQFGELPYLQEDDKVYYYAYSSDGDILAVGLMNDIISLYEISNWKRTQRLARHDREVTRLSFSTTKDRIAYDHTSRLWNLEIGQYMATISAFIADIISQRKALIQHLNLVGKKIYGAPRMMPKQQ